MPAGPNEAERRAERRLGSTVGKYRLDRVLGVGGMASVYLGVHRNGHRVAVKMLHPEISVDPDLRARFVREGYAANAIEHRGVVRVLDDDQTEDGSAFLVMELLEGETLNNRCKRGDGKLPLREALVLGHQLLDVIAAAHAKGIVHRDIKPDNVFVTTDGLLKVLDFGIARMRMPLSGSDPTHTGRAMGTPAFMGPEQALGRARDVDERSDVFACGATLFSILSGKLVHEAETAQEQAVYAATRRARPISSVAPDLPQEVCALVDKAIAFERAERWQTAAQMRDAIARVYKTLYAEPPPSTVAPGHDTTTSRSSLESAPTIDARAGGPTDPSAGTKAPVSGPPRATGAVRGRTLALLAGAAGLVALGALALTRPRSPQAPAAPPAPSAQACTSASCSASTTPSVCRKGACVPLTTEDCAVMARPEDVANEATIWIGVMFPTRGPMVPEFQGALRAVDLARRDFIDVSNGLPASRPGGPVRPLATLVCDDGEDPPRAARHLVDEIGVPAVIGFARSKEVVDLAVDLFNPRGVLALAANTAPMISDIPRMLGQPRLVWRTTISVPVAARTMAAVVGTVIEPELRRTRILRHDEPMRVALVRTDNTSGIGLSDALVSSLRYNDRSVAQNGEGSYREIVMTDAGGRAGRVAADDGVAAQLLAFRPHVVLDAAGEVGGLASRLESLWPAAERFRPRYLAQGTLSGGDLATSVARNPELARRLFGVDTAIDTPAVAKFVLRYNQVFTPSITAFEASDAPYDAFYLLALAIAALGDAPIDGASLARAIPRLQGGTPVDVGPGGIYAALGALGRGESIDLRGTVTTLDFDEATGDAPATYAVFCFKPDANGHLAPAESGLSFAGKTGEPSGELRCP
jgi:serine/threonine protein kinase